MRGHFRGHSAARLTSFVVAVVALVVAGALPAAAADTTPPTLVSFSRTSAASVIPGQAVTLSYTASDASGVASVVFHFTDALGNDRFFSGSGGGPSSVSSTVSSTWTAGTYRLDEITLRDNAGNWARYIYPTASFNLDTADFTVTGTTVALKPTIRGTIDRTGLPASNWLPVVNGYVVQANWKDLQLTQGADITPGNVIDTEIARLRTFNAQYRGSAGQPPLRLKLRVFAGDAAPDWAKNLDGLPVTVRDADDSKPAATVGRFWTANFGAAYQDFMTKLAARYDGVPEVRDVVVSRCTLTTAEPFLRMTSDQTSIDNLIAAGFTTAADHTCHQQEVDVHKAVWQRTTSSVAFTPYQQINPDHTKTIDEDWTAASIGYCRDQLGPRCVLESNSIKDPSVPRAPNYGPMYNTIQLKGPPIAYQTASPNNGLTSLCNTLGWAGSQGTGAVELPQAYVRDGVSTVAGMRSYDKALEGVQPADTTTPSVPGAFSGTVSGPTSINLTWNASSDSGYGVACYTISRGGVFLGTTMNTSFTDAGASTSSANSYTVAALDGAGHKSAAASTTVAAVGTPTTSTTRPTTTTTKPTSTTTTTRASGPTTTTTTIKATRPSAPQNFAVTSQCTGALLSWTPPANTGGAAITSYRIYRGGWAAETFLASVPGTATSYNDVTGGT